MSTADIPDDSNVEDWYPDSMTYNQANADEIKKYITLSLSRINPKLSNIIPLDYDGPKN